LELTIDVSWTEGMPESYFGYKQTGHSRIYFWCTVNYGMFIVHYSH